MKVVFETSTGLDAHMISNLLEQHNIASRIDGEYLQGGVGDLQAINLVRVLVDENDYSAARKVIEEWESKQPTTETSSSKSSNKYYGITSFLIGLVIGIGATVWAYNSPVSSKGIDYNNDGVLDEKWTYRNDRIIRTESDRNLDGKFDHSLSYDRRGLPSKVKTDDNFDGFFETEISMKNGNYHYQETDIDQDGNIDYKIKFKHGTLDEIQIGGNGKSSPTKWQKFKMNKLVSSKFDSDGDGKPDIAYEYDYFEEIKSKTYIND